jgi:hypothetical protein
MRKKNIFAKCSKVLFVIVLASAAAACGGSKGEAKTAGEAKAAGQAKVNLSTMDQLKGLSTDLQAQLDTLMAPVNEVDALVNQITSMPSRLGVDSKALLATAKATVENGKVAVSADISSDAAVRAEVEQVLGKLKKTVDGLKAIPTNAKNLVAKAAQALVAVPVLGAKVTFEANVKLSNPFGAPLAKEQAQADIQSVAQVQAEVQGKIQQVQQKVVGLPTLATSALAKLAASFAG